MAFPRIGAQAELLGLSQFLSDIGAMKQSMQSIAETTIAAPTITAPAIPNIGELVTQAVSSAGMAMQDFGRNVASVGLTLTGLTAPIADLGRRSLSMAADFEQSKIAFEVMLGSAKKGDRLLKDLFDFAAKTPFEFPQIKQAATTLLSLGTSAEDIPDILRSIGDVSAGTGQRVEDLALIYGKVQAKGKLAGETINAFAERGVPIIGALSKQFGVTDDAIFKMVSHGKISFAEFQQAFNSLSDEGGRFAGLMERQSQSLGGLWSTLQDTIGQALTKIGLKLADTFDLQGLLSDTIAGLGSVLDKMLSFADANPVLFKVVAGIAAIATISGPALIAVGQLISTIGVAVTAIAPLAGTIASLAVPIAGLIALGALLAAAWQNDWGNIREIVGGLGDALKAVFSVDRTGFLNAIAGIGKTLGLSNEQVRQMRVDFAALWDTVSSGIAIAGKLGDAIGAVFAGDRTGFLNAVAGIGEKLGLSHEQVRLLRVQFAGLWDTASSVLNSIGDLFGSVFSGDLSGATDAIAGILTSLGASPEAIAAATTAFANLWTFMAVDGAAAFGALAQFIGSAMTAIGGIVQSALASMQSFWADHGAQIMAFASAAWAFISDIVTSAAGAIVAFVQSALASIQAFWTAHGAQITTAASSAWEFIASTISSIAGAIVSLVQSTLSSIQAFWGAHGAQITAVVSAIFSGVRSVFDAAFGFLSTLVSGNLAVISAFWTAHGDSIIAVISFMWSTISTLFSAAFAAVSAIIQFALAQISAGWAAHGDEVLAVVEFLFGALKGIFDTATAVLSATISAVIALIEGDWTGFGESMRSITESLWAGIKSAFDAGKIAVVAIFDSIWTALQGSANAAVSTLRASAANIANAVRDAFSLDWGSVGKSIIDGIAGGLASASGAVAQAARDAALAAIEAARGALGIKSPSKVFAEIGINVGEGLVLGIDSKVDSVTKTVGDVAKSAIGAYTNIANKMPNIIIPTANISASTGSIGASPITTNDNRATVTVNNYFSSDNNAGRDTAWSIRQAALQLSSGGVF